MTRSWLASWVWTPTPTSDLVLAVNEAASNAIEHAYARPGPADVVVVHFWTEPHHFNFYVTTMAAGRQRWQATATAAAASRSWMDMIDSVDIQHDVDGTRVLMRHPIRW